MSAPTPGPWTFSEWNQFGDTRFYVAQQEGAPYTPDFSDVCTLIAETVSSERVTVQQANARLIAAAPELLAALNDILVGIEASGGWAGDDGLFDAGMRAYKKATGGAA